MAKTAQLNLPLLMPSQAQKHVTVNEALTRLDAAVQARVESSSVLAPPEPSGEGTGFLVPPGAGGPWQDKAGQIAVRSNGGWIYLAPRAGWRVWDASLGSCQVFDGTGWQRDSVAVSSGGAGTGFRVLEFDHEVVAGAENATSVAIPAGAQVLGVTGRVVIALAGSGLASWRVGVGGAENRYGSGIGTGLNSVLVGLSGSPVTYYAATPLLLAAEGGMFASGRIRLAIHLLALTPPRLV